MLVEDDQWMQWIFSMCWHQHGGSGLSFTLSEVQDMPVDDFFWFLDVLGNQRQYEAEQIAKAMKGK